MTKRIGESGNIFFTLFGAVALVGIIGVATSNLMRGPVGTVMKLNQQAKAESQLQIARKMAALEAAQQTTTDCDFDTFLEPLPPDTSSSGCTALGLTGGGCLPSTVGASKNDPWGTRVGYCAWDHGPTTGTCDPGLLDGTNGSGEIVIAVISAGPDRNFDASCSDDPGYVTAGGDDIIMEWTYDDAVQGAGGLWGLKSSDPDTAEILNNKNIEVGGSAAFQSSASFARDVTLGGLGSRLDLTAGSLLNLPDQTVLGICNAANDRALRVDTSVGMVLQICENGVGWVDIGGSGSASSVAGADGDVQFNSGDALYAVDTFNYDVLTDRLRIGGNAAADDTLEVTGTADISGDLQANRVDVVTGGNAAAVGLSFNSAGTLGVYGSGSTVGLAVGGSTRLSATSTSVGVTGNFVASGTGSIGGTLGVSGKATISNDMDVTGALQVDGDISDSNSAVTVNDDLVVNQSLQVGTSFAADNFELDTIGSGEGMYLYTSGAGTGLSLNTSGVERLTIDGGGNSKFTGDVGIGLASDPTTGLDVGGLFRLRSDPGITAGTACTLDGSITYTSGDELLICSNITGDWETIGTSGGGGGGGAGIWERTTGTIRINPTYFNDADNFVVGSSQIDDEGSGAQDERMLFENATGAFRAGVANGTEWDTRGNYSAALGLNTQATADSTFAVGNNAQARATEAIAMGRDVTVAAGALNSMALGLGTAAGVDPQITGTSSLGVFMQDQSGVTFAADNTMGIFGGKLMIDPNAAATQLATSGSLTVDVEGDVGAIQFCSEDGTFCFTAQDVATGSTGAPGNDREVIFNSAGSLYTNTNFVFTSAGQLGLGTSTPQSRVHAYNGGSTASLMVEGTETASSDLNLLTSGDGASTVGDATATGWTFSARGNSFATASVQNDLMYYYWDGSAYQQRFLLENDTGNLVLSDTDVVGDTKLDVDGTIKMSYGGETCDASREGAIRFMSSDNSFYVCQALANGWQRIITAGSSGAGIPAGGADREIQFNSGGDLAGLSTFVLTSAGRFGLGTATPAQTFDVTGTANVTGATTLGSSLGVTGQVNFSSGLNVTNATVLSNTLDVTGATTLNNTLDVVGANATTLGGSLGVTGQVDFSSGLNVTNATVLSDVLYVSGAATLASSLDVTGQVNFSSGLNVTNATVLSNTLDVTGATTLDGLLTTTADANLGGLVTFTSSGAVLLPVGDTGQRPNTASNGMIRYNTDNGKYEAYQGGLWQDILTSAVAGGAGAPDRGVQFNSGGDFTADANFTYTSAGDLIVGSYQIEDTGTGAEDSRMFFDVSNSAFRAGNVNAGQWDYASAGQYSTAFGWNVEASGLYSFAAGEASISNGYGAVALGGYNRATANNSVALGNNAYATGNQSVALGSSARAAGDSVSFAVGGVVKATGEGAMALGHYATAGDGAFNPDFSASNQSSGAYSMAVGLISNVNDPATDPVVTGQQSLGIFMGNQDAVDLTSNNTMGLFGGKFVIDPSIPAVDVVADTALDVSGTIKMAYGGEACDANREGAIRFMSSDNSFYVCQALANGWQRIITAGSGGAGLPASGNDREIQFNSGGDLAASSTFVLTSAGRFGLGTATPTQTFDVTGTANISGATTLGSSLGVTGQVDFSSGLNVALATDLASTLGVTGATTLDGLLTTNANSDLGGLVTFSSTGAFVTNVGTTAQRPSAVQNGMFRFNSDTNQFEGYNGADWNGFMTGAAGVDRQILFNSGGAVTGNADLVFEAAGNVNIGAGNFYFTSAGRLGIGTTTPTLTGAQPLIVDIEGATGSQFFCDENGNNCFTAAAVAGGSAPAPGADTQIVYNSGGVLYAQSGLVYTSAGRLGIGTTSPTTEFQVSQNVNSAVSASVVNANAGAAAQAAFLAYSDAGFVGLAMNSTAGGGSASLISDSATGIAVTSQSAMGGISLQTGATPNDRLTVSNNGLVTFSSTGAFVTNVGTTAQRPSAVQNGMFRFNSDTNQFEGYNGADWNGFMTGAAGADRQILFNSGGAVTGNANLVFDAAGNVNVGAGDFYFTSAGRLGIGTTTPTLTGAQPLMVDVEGAAGAQYFCDNNGNNCFTAAAVAGGGAPAPGADTQVVYNSGGVLYASSGFVFSSAGHLGIGTSAPSRMLHVLSQVDGTARFESMQKSFVSVESFNDTTGSSVVALKLPSQQWNVGTNAVDGQPWENDFVVQDVTNLAYSLLIENATSNVGLSVLSPQTRLDVDGTIKMAYGGEACDANREGAIHFDSAADRFFVCQNAAEGWIQIATNNADPSAPDRGIQFNSGGAFTAAADLVYQSTGVLELTRTYTGNDAGSENGIFTTLTVEPTGNQTVGGSGVAPNQFAGHFYGTIPAANTFQVNSLVGLTGSVENYGTGAVEKMRGSTDWVYNASMADVVSIRGRNTHIRTDGGNITEFSGDVITTNVAGGAVTDNYGLWVDLRNTGGTITNRYGVYLDAPVGAATNDYGIYQAGTQRNYLAGDLGIGVQYASAALDVAGTIKIADGGETCTVAGDGGMVRWNGTLMQYCDGAAWQDFASGATASPAAPDRGIQFNSGGSFAATSNFTYTSVGDFIVGSSQINDIGSGTDDRRMYFDVSSGAFRAGAAWADEWDAGNVGGISAAFGNGNTASGYSAFAAGEGNIVAAGNGFASGAYNTIGASAGTSVAFGGNNVITGQQSISVGGQNTVSGNSSAAFGYYASAGGLSSFAFGNETQALADHSLAIGLGNPTGFNANPSIVSGQNSYGIFMGAQDNVTLSSSNTFGLFGGKFVIDPSVPATDTVADTALDVNGTIKIAYGGETCNASTEGAIRYDSAANTFSFCALTANDWETVSLGAGTLAALSDTTIAAPANGEVLYYSGGGWYNGDAYRIADSDGNTYVTTSSDPTKDTIEMVAGGTQYIKFVSTSAYTFPGADVGPGIVMSKPIANDTVVSIRSGSTSNGSATLLFGHTWGSSSWGSIGTEGTDVDGSHSLHVKAIGNRAIKLDTNSATRMTVYDNGLVRFNSSGAVVMPVGTTAQRPVTAENGMIRYNSTSDKFEGYQGGTWQDILTSAVAGGAAAPDRGIQFNSGGDFAAATNFVYTSAGDLIVGSYQIEDTGTGSEDYRMYFDVSTGAFRAGRATAGEWDYSSSGAMSFAAGNNNVAIGIGSTALGTNSTADGTGSLAAGSSAITGSGTNFAIGAVVEASGIASMATGYYTLSNGVASFTAGNETQALADYSFAFGLGDTSGFNTAPSQVTGQSSFGIFMGAQDSVDLAAANTMGLFGGSMVIDPNVPATNLSADTALDVNGTIKIDYGGEACDANREGSIQFTSAANTFYFCANTANGWESVSLGAGTLAALSDTTIAGPANGEVLYYSGSGWVNNALAINDLSDGITNYTSGNMYVGFGVGASSTTASYNTAFGSGAGNSITSGGSNTAFGYKALNLNATGIDNVAVGRGALNKSTADDNTAIGTYALLNNTSGVENTAIGRSALYTNTIGSDNVAIGIQSLLNATGDLNTAIGSFAGSQITSGDRNIMIGYNVQAPSQSVSNYINIGDVFYGSAGTGELFIGGDGALTLPSGVTATRPGTLAGTTAVNGMIRYNSTSDKFEGYQAGSWQDMITTNVAAAAPDRGIQFNSGGDFAADANFTYTSTGSLGIGTAAPNLIGSATRALTLSATGASEAVALELQGNTPIDNAASGVVFYNSAAVVGTINSVIKGTTSSGALAFSTFYDGTETEVMRLSEFGVMGVGTIAPQVRLDVNGEIRLDTDGVPCDANREGAIRYDSAANTFSFCALAANDWETISLGAGTLAALSDTTIAAPSAGQVLYYSGTQWVNNTFNLNNLGDVDTTGFADGEVLLYSAGAAGWVPGSAGISNSNFTDLADTPSAYTGQSGKFARVNSGETALEFTDQVIESVTGANAPTTFDLNDLGDVTSSGATDAQVLQYDSATGNWVAATLSSGSVTAAGADGQIQYNSNGGFAASSTFVYTSAGYLGLGVASPSEMLDVAGGIKFASSSLACNTAAHEGAMQFGSGGSQIFEVCANSVTGWQQLTLGGAVGGALGDLSDVTVSSLVDGQFLSYNSATGDWVNASIDASIWNDSGAGYIEYNSGYGGMRVANITGAAAPVGATRNVVLSPSTISAAGNDRELQFNSGGSLSATSTLVFTSAGQLGIGLGTPSAMLDVAGEIKFASSSLACSTAVDEGAMQYGSGGSKIFEVCADSATGWEQLALGGTVAGAFTDLSDTPSAYTGQGGRFAVVNAGETGLSFTDTVVESVTGQPAPNRMVMTDLDDVSTSGVLDQQYLQYDSASGTWLPTTISLGSGSVTAAGADTQIQFNSGGTFYASSGFVYDYANGYMGVGTSTPSAEVDVVGDIKVSNNLILSPISGLASPTYISSGSYSLNSLTDVDTTGYADGNVLLYSAGASGWIPGTSASASAINDLTDVDTTGFADGNVLLYSAGASGWVPGTAASNLSGLTDTTLTAPSNGQVLTYNGSAWVNSAASGLWTDSGSGYIEYSSTYGGMKVASITGASLPTSGAVGAVSGGGASAINDLTDVDTTGFADGNVLLYSAGASGWVPGTVSGGGGGALDDLSDATTMYSSGNMFVGQGAGASNTTSNNMTAIGYNALNSATFSNHMTAVGAYAGATYVPSSQWAGFVAIGSEAARYIGTSAGIVAVGNEALQNFPGSRNTTVGNFAMASSNGGGGDDNIGIGDAAGAYMSGHDNVIIGASAFEGGFGGDYDHTGYGNVIIGKSAAENVQGSTTDYNIIIGEDAALSLRDGASNIVIGRGIDVSGANAANEMNIANVFYASGLYSTAHFGINNSAPNVALDVTGDIEYTGTITDVSDMRLKTDITPLDTDEVMARLAQVDTYSFRMKDDPKGRIEFGVMAQELEKVFPELVKTANDEMGTKSVNYVGLIAPLIEASKELRSENDDLRAQITEMQTAQAQFQKDIMREVNGLKAHTGYGISKAQIGLWTIALMFGFSSVFFMVGGILRHRQRKQE